MKLARGELNLENKKESERKGKNISGNDSK
jgi:hypothetical protein